MTCDTCLIVLTKVCLPPATEASTAAPEEDVMKAVFYEDDVLYYGCGYKKNFDDEDEDEDTTSSKTKNAASSLSIYHWSSLYLMPPVFFYLPEFVI